MITCKTAMAYQALCKMYGWRPNMKGLRAFAAVQQYRWRWLS